MASQRRAALALALALPAAGCSTTWNMMPTPVAYREGAADPLAGLDAHERSTTTTVLYATDRTRRDTDSPEYAYAAGRHTALRLGVATVRLGPKDTTWDDVADATRSGRRPPMRIVEIDELGPLWTTISSADEDAYKRAAASDAADDPVRDPANAFAGLVNARLADAATNDVLVYVPGFNTPFATPVHMMAQFQHFMGRDVVCIAYSWPARSTWLGYGKQLQTAGTTVRKLRELLVLLADKTDAQRIHVLGYSSGAQVLSNALLQLRLTHAGLPPEQVRARAKIGHVIYAGADEDVEYVRGLVVDRVGDLFESVTIYMSRTDAAMILARVFGDGTDRLGRALHLLSPVELDILRQQTHAAVVDVTSAVRAAGGGDVWSHAYWYLNPWVSTDVIARLRFDLDPAQRALERTNGDAFWTFPDDYPDEITAIIEAGTPPP